MKTGKSSSRYSNSEIQIILDEGTIKEIDVGAIAYLEKYQTSKPKLNKKGVEERQKIIDSQVDTVMDSNF
jgi:hypothetical protein